MLGLGDGGRIFLLSSPHETFSKAFKCLKFDYRKLSILFLPVSLYHLNRLPWWLSGKEPTCQCRRHGFDPWVGKIPWRRKWQPTPVFLPGESHGRRGLAGYSPWGRKESDMTERLHFFTLMVGFHMRGWGDDACSKLELMC